MTNLLERALRYRRIHGTRKFIRDALARLRQKARRGVQGPAETVPLASPDVGWVNSRELVAHRWGACTPLRVFTLPASAARRVTVVTDSINRGSLYGGVGTAIIVAALLAERRGARLRIVTRSEKANPSELGNLLAIYGLSVANEVEFAFAHMHDPSHELDLLDAELFITTSWWTTAATMGSVRHSNILYLLQEDERMFYPHGDEHLRCSNVLRNSQVQVAVNTRLLYDHLVGSGLADLARRATWFEPAFPPTVFYPRLVEPGAKRTLMFYARPNNLRNLFYFGLELLETAIERGVVDLGEWDVVLVGKEIPKIRLDDGRYTPRRLENLRWGDYSKLVGSIDLGLCLMYTPHPSYPPFDVAASGGVAVTNRFGDKHDLSGYSANIVCGDLDIESMLQALAQGISLARDTGQRRLNHRSDGLSKDWRQALAGVLDRFGAPG